MKAVGNKFWKILIVIFIIASINNPYILHYGVHAEPLKSVEVASYEELEAAMKDKEVDEINVTADIYYTNYTSTTGGESNLTVPARDLKINGNNHTIDFRRRGYLMNFSSTKITIEINDLKMFGQNYWGPFRLSGSRSAGSSCQYNNMDYTGAQLTASYESNLSFSGTIHNYSVNSYTSPADEIVYKTQANQTTVEATNVDFAADTTYVGKTDNGTVFILGTAANPGSVKVGARANIDLTGGGNGLSGEGEWTTIQLDGNLTIEDSAVIKITTPEGSTRGGIALGTNSNLLLKEGAALLMDMNGPFTDAYNKNPIYIGSGATVEVNDRAKLMIQAASQGTGTGSLIKTGSKSNFTIGQKATFRLSSDGSGLKNLIAIGTNSDFSFENAQEVDLDASLNTNKNTKLISMNGTFHSSIQQVESWLKTEETAEPSYIWTPLYNILVTYTGTNVTKVEAGSTNPEVQADFIANYRTQNFKRVRFSYIPDVELTLGVLSDNHSKRNSYTIEGTANPGAWIRFSGDASIPAGDQHPSGTEDVFHVQADENGRYSYQLPAGSYFTGGNEIEGTAFLNGKQSTAVTTVLDETAPGKPVLHALKDTDRTIQGTAEPNSLVEIIDKKESTVFLSGTANADGDFSFNIPPEKLPLMPYRLFHAQATDQAGNKSEFSNVVEVADTLPPTATAIPQILPIHSDFPTDISQLLKNFEDNDGNSSADIQAVIVKAPDMDTIGYTEATVNLTDKAGNSRSIAIPVFIKGGDSVVNDDMLLDASNFQLMDYEVPSEQEELEKVIIAKSKARAWQIPSGKQVTELTISDFGGIKAAEGLYQVTIQAGKLERQIQVKVNAGALAFKQTPEAISFGTQTIKAAKQTVKPATAVQFIVEDNRAKAETWRLMAKLDKELQTDTGQVLPASFFVKDQEEKQWLTKEQNVPVYTEKEAKPGEKMVDLSDQLFLVIAPGNIRADKEYHAKITWTLENAP